jgi:N-acetylmuramoyl-L-alanine amidase
MLISAEMSGRGGSASDTPFHLVNRSAWGARMPKDTTPFPHPPAIYAVIIHTESAPCDAEAVCSAVVRDIQHFHMDTRNFSDIAYNFLVGGDGETYEGRGWDVQGAFAKEFNNRSLGIAFIGNALISNLETQFLRSRILAQCC